MTVTIQPLDQRVMEEIGLTWHTDADGSSYIDRFFLWSGDVRLLLALVKLVEDEGRRR